MDETPDSLSPAETAAAEACGYELPGRIGGGAYGEVYLARKDGVWFAVKFVRRSPLDPARFEREWRGVRTVSRLPPVEGLVRLHDVRTVPGGDAFFYAMDLADDEEGAEPAAGTYRPRSLASVVDAEIALPLAECLDIGIRIAGALATLQRHHIVHRDVKPSNILFFAGKAVLADVGLMADARETASLVGTPGYAPPEGRGSAGGDVFGLGKTLWRIGTGRPPADAGLPPCAEAEIESPLFWKWLAVLAKATARDPALRHRSAKALLKDLRSLRRAARLYRHRVLRRAALAAACLVFLPLAWTLPDFRMWRMQDEEFRYHTSPPGLWKLVKPLFAPREDPMVPNTLWHFELEVPEIDLSDLIGKPDGSGDGEPDDSGEGESAP